MARKRKAERNRLLYEDSGHDRATRQYWTWQAALTQIWIDLEKTRSNRTIVKRMFDIMKVNPRVGVNNPVYSLILNLQYESELLCIRRLTDIDHRALSLWNLVAEIRAQPDILKLNFSTLKGHSKELNKISTTFREIVSKSLAHNDWEMCEDRTTPDKIDSCFDAIAGIVDYYLKVFKMEPIVIRNQRWNDWIKIFRVPWLTDTECATGNNSVASSSHM